MRRREFITALGLGIAWTRAAVAQPADRVRRIGLLMTIAEQDPETQARLAALRRGLAELGWQEGRNLRIEYRYAAGETERARAAAVELVSLAPDAILATGRAMLAILRQETRTIPVVFVLVPDPVGDGLVDSLARPGGNLTGLTNVEFSMSGKWLELLKEAAPRVARVAVLFNSETSPNARHFLEALGTTPQSLATEVIPAPVRAAAELEGTLASFAGERNDGLMVLPEVFTATHYEQIVALASRQRLPAIYAHRHTVAGGGLMSYGVDTLDLFHRAGSYIDRILRGASPADLPVEQPTKFELVINLKTAKALGLEVPPTLLARADEVIE
jgi:putative ABC transport system substrate-binding protein